MFKVKVEQLVSQQKVTVFIFESEDGAQIRVFKKYNFGKQQVDSASILMGRNFFSYNVIISVMARQAEEWYRIAAATAETLDRIFQTREDLRRRVMVRMVGKTVAIDFQEEQDAPSL